MAQLPPFRVAAMARDAGGVEIGGAAPVAQEGQALPLGAPEAVVHVAEHHQRQGTLALDPFHRQRQVLITPVAGRTLPVAAAGSMGLASQPARTTMGQQHQG